MVSKKKTTKKETTILDMHVHEIFVAQSNKQRAYSEQFRFTSVNFTQKHLGTLCGFFIIRNNNPTNAHIVHYLAAEIKKEFFAVSKRTITAAFEAALHHGNRALAALANKDHVSWIGALDGVVCAFDDKNISLSVTGDGQVFLIRDQELITLSEGLASPEAAENPLKTFVDTAQGPLRAGDKIIITSSELLQLISLNELQRNAMRFTQADFAQFIKTTLTNECVLATAIVIDICEKVIHEPLHTARSEETPADTIPNAFDGKTFHQPDNKTPHAEHQTKTSKDTSDKTYTDHRTGHIYVQGEQPPDRKHTRLSPLVAQTKDLLNDTLHSVRQSTKNIRRQPTTQPDTTPPSARRTFSLHSVYSTHCKVPCAKIATILRRALVISKTFCTTSVTTVHRRYQALLRRYIHHKKNTPPVTTKSSSSLPQKISPLLPQYHALKKLWASMSLHTKWLALAIILFIIGVPFLLQKIYNHPPTVITPDQQISHKEQPAPPASFPDTMQLLARPNIIDVIPLKDTILAIDPETITLYDTTQKSVSFPIPDNSGQIIANTYMEDLSLLFLFTDHDLLYSFSPITKKFHQQSLPQKIHAKDIRALGSFLTYLYIVDDTSITRYARTTGGFDTPTPWFTDGVFADVTDLAIDGNVYIAKNGTLDIFFKREKIQKTIPTSVLAHYVYSTTDTQFLWILDTEHGTITAHDKESLAIKKTFTDRALTTATTFSVQEKDATAVVATEHALFSVPLNEN